MRVYLQYWSSTGNTALAARLAAQALAEAGAEVEVEVADLRRSKPRRVPRCDLWVVASPVYAFRPALPVEEYLQQAKAETGTPAAAVLTHGGFPDRAPARLGELMRQAGAAPWRWADLLSEDAWPVLRRFAPRFAITGEPSPLRREKFASWWRDVPERLGRDAAAGWRRRFTPFSPLSGFYRRSVLRRAFQFRVDLMRCVRCGLCEEHCPTGRMKIANFPRPAGDCVGCYGCVNICPQDAVDTWLTRGAPRYRGPKAEMAKPR